MNKLKILSTKCKQFFGTENTKGFCSVCFKTDVKLNEEDLKNNFNLNE